MTNPQVVLLALNPRQLHYLHGIFKTEGLAVRRFAPPWRIPPSLPPMFEMVPGAKLHDIPWDLYTINALMETLGMSASRLARNLGIDRTATAKWINVEGPIIPSAVAQARLHALHAELSDAQRARFTAKLMARTMQQR